MLYRAFLFDYKGFQQRIAPLIEAVDRGDYKPLQAQAETIINSMPPEEWLLQDQGTMLENIDPSKEINSGDIGYWLLILLSTFLQRAPSHTGWGLLREILPAVGWSDEDAWLLVRGLSTASLLKPGSDVTQDTFLQVSDSYWYWMIPTQSYQRGWLPLEQIHRLKHQLASAHDAILSLDPTAIGVDIWVDRKKLPSGEAMRHVAIAYDAALVTLQAAEEAGRGLFIVIS